MNSYENGRYKAIINLDNTVIISIDDIEIDKPGPWDTFEGADEWAQAIINDMANGVIHYRYQEEHPEN